jgi:hypothetical protein
MVKKPEFDFELTQLISFACNDVKQHMAKTDKQNRKCILISYADKIQNHHGGIYQAASWNYHGVRMPLFDGFYINGIYHPTRTCYDLWKTCSWRELERQLPDKTVVPHLDAGKHLYWHPLSKYGSLQAKRMGLRSMPYPKPDEAVRKWDGGASKCEFTGGKNGSKKKC